jgi:hypothetical protein
MQSAQIGLWHPQQEISTIFRIEIRLSSWLFCTAATKRILPVPNYRRKGDCEKADGMVKSKLWKEKQP